MVKNLSFEKSSVFSVYFFIFLGNALQLSRFKSTEAAYIAWSKEYGDIFTFWFGERAVIAVSSYEKIVEYFQKRGEQFQDRPDDRNLMNYTRGGFNGLIHIFGDRWKSQRRFALHSLRDFGLGKDIMEERVLEECTYLVDSVNESHKDAVAIPQLIDRAVGSIINNLLFGYRYTENNIKEFKVNITFMYRYTVILGPQTTCSIFPPTSWPSFDFGRSP